MRWKWIPVIFVSILLLLIAAAYTILSGYDFNKLKPRIERAAYEATGRELKLKGDIGLKIGLTPTIVVEDVSLQNAKWGSRPTAISIKRFEVQVALLPLLGGNIDVKRLIIIEPDILLENNAKGESNLKFTPPEKKKRENVTKTEDEPDLPELLVGKVLLKSGRLTYRDAKSGKSTTIKLTRLNAEGTGADDAINIDMKGSFGGMPFGISGRLDSMAKLRDFSAGPLKLSALKVKLGRNLITGSIEANLGKRAGAGSARPLIKAYLKAESLDLGEFINSGKTAKEKKPAKKSKKTRLFSKEPFPVESMKLLDLDLRVRVKKLFLPPVALKDLNVKVSLKRGRLKVAPLKAGIGGGTLDAEIDLYIKGKTAALETRVKVDNLDIGKVESGLKIAEAINGVINADIKATGRGDSVAALMGSLDGEFKVVMRTGRIENKLLRFAGGDLGSNLLRLLNPLAGKQDDTRVNCAVADFNVNEGLAKSSALFLDTSYMSVIGKGRVNLKTERINITLNPTPKKGLGTSGLGKLTLSLGELARPFKLGGTLANPGLAIDTARTVLTLGKVIGGKALLGPAGIATMLLGTSNGDDNPCLTAIEAHKKSVKQKPVEPKAAKERTVNKRALPIPAEVPIPEEIKNVGEDILKLFGK